MIEYIDRTLVNSFEPELLSFQEAIENVLGYKMTESQSKSFTTLPTRKFLNTLNISEEEANKIRFGFYHMIINQTNNNGLYLVNHKKIVLAE